uniref:Uncharacterized protein n=1 Tax=Phlebotomus kandelakii TaxID=1109342 RepID=A0A6B2ELC1_9DIPT
MPSLPLNKFSVSAILLTGFSSGGVWIRCAVVVLSAIPASSQSPDCPADAGSLVPAASTTTRTPSVVPLRDGGVALILAHFAITLAAQRIPRLRECSLASPPARVLGVLFASSHSPSWPSLLLVDSVQFLYIHIIHDSLEGLIELLRAHLKLQQSSVHLDQEQNRLDALSDCVTQHIVVTLIESITDILLGALSWPHSPASSQICLNRLFL